MSGKIEFVQGYRDVYGNLHDNWYEANAVNLKHEQIVKLYEWVDKLPYMPRKEEIAEHIHLRWKELEAIMASEH